MKRNKANGITLIALVITIIVLLILAGVAIATLTGDNGVLTKAVLAKEATRGGEVKDYVRMAVAENAMAENTNGTRRTRTEVISELSAQGKLTAEEVAKLTDEENPVDVITIGGIEIDFGELGSAAGGLTLVQMYDKAVADNCTNENGNCTDPEHLHIGDYVDYKNPTSGSKRANAVDTGYDTDQIYEASKNQLNWRVLGKDSATGGIKLISGRPMKSNNGEEDPYLHLEGAKGYINAETVLNDLCSLYTTEYGEARSVKLTDINEITGITTDEKIKQFNKVPNWWWWGSKQYGESYSFPNHYTPESWLDGEKQVTVSGTVSAYAYTVNSGEEPIVNLTNTRAYKMLFENVDEAYFWLASRSVFAGSGGARFCVGGVYEGGDVVAVGSYHLFGSDGGYEDDRYCGVRPVICLKSNITEKEVPRIADRTEETWGSTGSGNVPT